MNAQNNDRETGQPQGIGQPQGKGQPQGIAPTGSDSKNKPKTVGDMAGAFHSIVTVKYIDGVKSLGGNPTIDVFYNVIIRNISSIVNNRINGFQIILKTIWGIEKMINFLKKEIMPIDLIIYQNTNGDIKIDVRLEDEAVWLTQSQMGQLFGKDKCTISEYIGNIFKEGELDDKVVVREFRTTTRHGAIAGKTHEVEVNGYNLDVIISVGFRVKSL